MPDPRPLSDLDAARALPCDRCGDDGKVRVRNSRDRVVCPYCGGTRVVVPEPVVETEEVERGE